MATVGLDDALALRALDTRGMLERVHALPDQLDAAWALARGHHLPEAYRTETPKHVIGLGTGGGSRFTLGLARALIGEELPLDFLIRQGYELPTAVGPNSLVFALSHSGITRETVATVEQAVRRHARLVVVTAGGRLQAIATERGLPEFAIPDRDIMPRAAVGYLLAPVLWTLGDLGLIADKSAAIFNLVGYLRAHRAALAPESPSARNPAKQLAEHCLTGTPLIFHSSLTAVAADRLARQLSENGKLWAVTEALPEAHHDKIVGLVGAPPDRRDPIRFAVVFLRSAWETSELEARFEGTRRLLIDRGLVDHVHEVRPEAGDRWEELLHHVLIADYASCYTALTRGIDPTPVAVIDELKRLMGQGG